MDNWIEQSCRYCGKKLKGRIDKKYCDADCRNHYHNLHIRESEQIIFKYNSQLRLNRTILKKLCPVGKAIVSKEILEQIGFKFDYFTSIFPFKSGVYYFVYDYGFMPVIDDNTQKVLIIQKKVKNDTFNPWNYLNPELSLAFLLHG